jgi:LacI family transcriptional regulator
MRTHDSVNGPLWFNGKGKVGVRVRATQYDIARLTGMSQATISRALRGDPSVVPETRDRVMAACVELGYRPSIGARILAEGQRAVIGISLSRDALPTDRYVTLLHQALLQALDASGLGVSLLPANRLEAMLPSVGTVILIGVTEGDPRPGLCAALGVPVVAIGYLDNGFSVVPDDDTGPRLVVRHFHATGRRHLAVMSSWAQGHGPAMLIRRRAAEDEAARLGMTLMVLEALPDPTSTLSGYRTAMRDRDALVTADCLFCDTDEHAIGALTALRDLGRAVPDRIAVAGFDDLPGMAARLTTVRQGFDAIAAAAVALREEALAGKPARRITVPVSLQVRET